MRLSRPLAATVGDAAGDAAVESDTRSPQICPGHHRSTPNWVLSRVGRTYRASEAIGPRTLAERRRTFLADRRGDDRGQFPIEA